jgi:O-antigen/teichoic acid export membrane protein
MGADILGSGIGLITSPISTRLLTLDQYGAGPLLGTLWSIAAIFLFAGMDWAFPFFRANHPDRRSIAVTATFVAVISATVTCAAFSVIALTTDFVRQFAGVNTIELLPYLAGLLPSALVAWLLYLLRYSNQALSFARVSLLGRTLGALIALPAMALAIQEDRLLVGWWVASALSVVSVLWALRELSASNEPIYARSAFSPALARSMLRYGAALIPGGAIYGLVTLTDRFLIGMYLNPAEAGLYSLAWSLASITMLLKVWFARAWDPMLVEWVATKDMRIIQPNLVRAVSHIVVIMAPIPVLAAIWGTLVVEVLYPPAFRPVADLFPLLAVAGVISTLSLVAVATTMIGNTPRFHFPVYAGAFVLNALVGILFIPQIGLLGAVLGLVAAEAWILVSWILIGRFFLGNLRLAWSTALTITALAAIISAFYRPGQLLPNSILIESLGASIVLGGAWAWGWIVLRRSTRTLLSAG